jgi:superfamily II DNA or RNA helicase
LIELPGDQGNARGAKVTIKVADLVDDGDPARRSKVLASLKDPAQRNNRDHVDMIIALGMAKEGFDWIWCQHALTIGYRSSLTEIVQIIGRATRDAPGKERARFPNLIAEPDATEAAVAESADGACVGPSLRVHVCGATGVATAASADSATTASG